MPVQTCVHMRVWERVKLLHGKYDQHGAPGAEAQMTGTSLRHPAGDDEHSLRACRNVARDREATWVMHKS